MSAVWVRGNNPYLDRLSLPCSLGRIFGKSGSPFIKQTPSSSISVTLEPLEMGAGLSLNSSKDMNKAPTCKSYGVVNEPHSSWMHSEPNTEMSRFAPEKGLVPETAKRGDSRIELKCASQVRGSG